MTHTEECEEKYMSQVLPTVSYSFSNMYDKEPYH